MGEQEQGADRVADLRGADTRAAERKDIAKTMLSDHIPLSLLMDMSSAIGPDSEALFVSEGDADEEWWTQDSPPKKG